MKKQEPSIVSKNYQPPIGAIEKLTSSIDKLNQNIGDMDRNSTNYNIIMERVTWILLFLTLIQIILSFFPLLTYPWYVKFGMLIITGSGLLYTSYDLTKKK